jgi:hypothetical protein
MTRQLALPYIAVVIARSGNIICAQTAPSPGGRSTPEKMRTKLECDSDKNA